MSERGELLESPDAIVARADKRRADTASGRAYLRALCAERSDPLETLNDLHASVDRLLDEERFIKPSYEDTVRALVDAGGALRLALDRWPA